MDMSFYKNRKVLITGHTGFKGSWMCQMLIMAGAYVVGYALEPNTEPALYNICGLNNKIKSYFGDIRDLDNLLNVFDVEKPEIVIHMAAQPLVRESYINPVETYEINVMGTVNICEAVRRTSSVKSFVNVTTDKVYLNREWEWGYRECDELNGYDPYSNSKSCSELVTSSYVNSFFNHMEVAVSTVRAGNVIGGGDFAKDRIIPDCIRAAFEGKNIVVRNPYSTRPYQHVLEPIAVYLMIAQMQYVNKEKHSGSYNVGPDDSDCITTGDLVSIFCNKWNEKTNNNILWENVYENGPHEAGFLKLDCSKLKRVFDWCPRWDVETAVEKIVEWTDCYMKQGDIVLIMEKQITEFCSI